MSKTASDISRLATLSAQCPVRTDVAVRIFRQLLDQVASLHGAGRVHGNIHAETVVLTEGQTATLSPTADEIQFGGEPDAVELWPPELQNNNLPAISANIAAAQVALTNAKLDCDPRRIDIYQLGALLCRALTGCSVADYLHSPRTSGKIPPLFRRVVDGALGFAVEHRFVDCGHMQAALAEAAKTIEASVIADTPGWGSKGFIDPSRTPAGGSAVAQKEGEKGKRVERARSDGPNSTSPPLPFSPSPILPSAVTQFDHLGPYRIVARIGGGGMGDVYKAYEESLDRHVAIKVLPPDLARHDDFVRRFRAEATAVAKLVHPNVVQIHSIGEDGGRHFFAMQFVNGESLADLLHRRSRLPVDESLKIIEQSLAGLGAAHRAGMIHRDIKPGNILLDHDTHRALLADFGLVKAMGSEGTLTATGMVMGTVDYIPPEQARGQTVDGRADLYSIGVLMYQMLSGRLPFTADSPTGVIFQHAYEQPPPLSQVAGDIPRRLAGIVTRLMAKNPEHRYQSAEEVLADIAAFRSGKPPAAVKRNTSIIANVADDVRPALPVVDYSRALAATDAVSLSADEGWRTRIFNIFRRHAPQLVEKLQNTEQQVDGAIYEYERRHKELKELLRDAEDVTSELAAQVASHQEAAQETGKKVASAGSDAKAAALSAEKRRYEETAADFAAQLAEQQSLNGELHSKQATVEGTLKKLSSQRDLLLTRLQTAQAAANFEVGIQQRQQWRFTGKHIAVAITAAAALLVLALVWKPRPTLMKPEPPPTAAPSLAQSLTGRFYLATYNDCQVYVDGNLVLEYLNGKVDKHNRMSDVLTLHPGDIVVLRIKSLGESRAVRLAFVGEDGNTVWSPGRKDFHVLDVGLSPKVIDAVAVGKSTTFAEASHGKPEDRWAKNNLPKFDGDWFWYGGWGQLYQLGTVIGPDSFRPIAAASPAPVAIATPLPLTGQFYVVCKGTSELLLNDQIIARTREASGHQDRSRPVTLHAGDVLRVNINSGLVYRAIQIGFVSDNRKWIWPGRRQDFRVLPDDAPAELGIDEIANFKGNPEKGRPDTGIRLQWKDFNLPIVDGEWMWIGEKNEKKQFAAVIEASLFKSTEGLPQPSPEPSATSTPPVAEPEPAATSPGQNPFPMKGRFFALCNGKNETYLNGERIEDHVKLVTLNENDVLVARIRGDGGINAYQIAFASEDGRWIWPGRRQDFRVVDDLNPSAITASITGLVTEMPRFGTSDPTFLRHWDGFKLANAKCDTMWIGDGGKKAKAQWRQMALVFRPELFQPSDGIPLANKPIAAVPEPPTESLSPKATDTTPKPKEPDLSAKRFEAKLVPLGDAGSKLQPGLVVTEFPRKTGKQDDDKHDFHISLDDLGSPLGEPHLVQSLYEWKYGEANNAVAMGYLKIEEEGDYTFKSSSFYDRNFLLVNNKMVCWFRDRQLGIRSIKLSKGYVPIVSVGTVGAKGTVTVEWRPPNQNELTAIPEELLFRDPAAMSGGDK